MNYIFVIVIIIAFISLILVSKLSGKKKESSINIPDWANKPPLRVSYIMNKFEKKLRSDKDISSGRLLFELMSSVDAKTALFEIEDAYNSDKDFPFIWGCKLENGKLKYELFLYNFDNRLKEKRDTDYLLPVTFKTPHKNTIASSYDIYNKEESIGDVYHFYNAEYGQTLDLPFKGYATFLKLNSDIFYKDNKFICDERESFINNCDKYFEEIGVKNKNVEKLLMNYPDSKEICVACRNNNEIVVQYLGIGLDEFLDFLVKNLYPDKFIKFLRDNYEKCKRLRYEISISYDDKLRQINSGFYGII